jgi:hypothetical protein
MHFADLQESDLCDLEAYAYASEIGFGGYVITAKDGFKNIPVNSPIITV